MPLNTQTNPSTSVQYLQILHKIVESFSQTFIFDLTHSGNQIGVLQQLAYFVSLCGKVLI